MAIDSWLMDMDGVLVHEANALPGADRFLDALRERELPFLLLTNNSIYTRRDLAARLGASGREASLSSPPPTPRPPPAATWRRGCGRAGSRCRRSGSGPRPRRPLASSK